MLKLLQWQVTWPFMRKNRKTDVKYGGQRSLDLPVHENMPALQDNRSLYFFPNKDHNFSCSGMFRNVVGFIDARTDGIFAHAYHFGSPRDAPWRSVCMFECYLNRTG